MQINIDTILGIIPARFGSTRFPGKPLAMIGKRTMIQCTYEQTEQALQHVYVATDDVRIAEAVKAFGGKVVMTSEKHTSGTDRCFEALEKIKQLEERDFDIVINIQGDEPFIHPDQILSVASCFENPNAQIATLAKASSCEADIFDSNKPKVIFNQKKEAIYFSRSPIPFLRGEEKNNWHNLHTYYNHIGLYGYKSSALAAITKIEPSPLEKAESLEQLRWIEHGYIIACNITTHDTIAVDTPEDLERIIQKLPN